MSAMTMALAVGAKSAAAETAIPHAAVVGPASVRSRPPIRTAVARPDKTHRYRADGGGSHHRQYDAARTFHGFVLLERSGGGY
jgi:hypothetical protein